jgi:hypothetical protein
VKLLDQNKDRVFNTATCFKNEKQKQKNNFKAKLYQYKARMLESIPTTREEDLDKLPSGVANLLVGFCHKGEQKSLLEGCESSNKQNEN